MTNFVEDLIARLNQAQVEYVIVGGISAVLHGAPIVTRDTDICYRRTPQNIARLARALAPLQPRLRGLPPDLPCAVDERTLQMGTNFTLLAGTEELDLLGEMSAIGGYEQVVVQATDMTVAGVPVKVLSLAQLIATKKAAGRPKDLAVLPVLEATLELRQRQNPPPTPPDGPSTY
jgi:hypothetical protein